MAESETSYMPTIEEPALSAKLSAQLDRYRGRWVAVDNNQIIAEAESAQEVVRLAKQKGSTDPIVFRVPLHPERLNIL
jgi:hypothetical protein